jgi:hypothetical protein
VKKSVSKYAFHMRLAPLRGGSSAASIRNDQLELRRLTNVLFAFMRQALREQRHGGAVHKSNMYA